MTNANTEPVWKPQAERKRSGMYAPTNWHSFEDGGSEEVYFKGRVRCQVKAASGGWSYGYLFQAAYVIIM